MEQQCPFCQKQFAFASKLQRHLLTHTGQRPYSCVLCSKDFYQSAHLKRHLETHSSLSPIARTDDEVDLYLQPMATHELSVHNSHPLESSIDNYPGCLNLNEQLEMTEHLNTTDHWNSSRWNYTEVFTESENVRGKVFNASRDLNKQPRQGTVAKGKPHHCLVCSKHFGSPYKLRRHQLIHTGERPFKCSLCDKAFTQLSHLKLHIHSHGKMNSVRNPGVVLDHPEGPTQCDPGSSAEVYPSQLDGMNAIGSPTHADVPEFAKLPHFTLVDSSPSEMYEQAYVKPAFTVESPFEIKQVSEQHLTSTFPVKASYACDDIPSLDQAMACKLNDCKDEESKVSPPKKLGQSISEVATHRNSDDKNQTVPSYVSMSPKPLELLDPGQEKRSSQEERSSQKGAYECQTCFKSFSVPSKLHRHMLTHTGQRPFACHICARSFRQLCHLKLHLRTKACLKQTSKPVKKKARNISRKFPRDSGSLTIASKMSAHKDVNDCTTVAQSYSSVPDLTAVDRVRGKPSDSNEPMSHHIGCRSQDGSKHSDQTSKRSHSDLPEPVNLNICRIVHECPVCFKCFSSPSKLKRHCLIHTGQRPFQCYMCQSAFRQLAHLKVHYRVHERSGRKTPSLQRQGFKNLHSRPSTPRQKAFTCYLCGWKFRHQTHLGVHLQNHKSVVGTPPVSTLTKTSEHQNPMSSKVHRSYEPTQELVPGQRMSDGRMNLDNTPSKIQYDSMISDISGHRQSRHCCSVCFKCFNSSSALHRHSLNHSGLKPLKCLRCSKTFRQRAHLKVHRCLSKEGTQLAMHREDSNMTCNEVLDSQFATYSYTSEGHSVGLVNVIPVQGSPSRDQVDCFASLDFVRDKRHTPIIPEPTYVPHKSTLKPTKQKGYPCTICQRHFSVPSKLARHLLIHMGIKPFTCEVCGRSFRQSCHLQTHLNIHRKRRFSGALSSGPSAASTSRHLSAPQNLLKENTVTKQNTIQKNLPQIHSLESPVTVKKAGKSEHLCPSKSNHILPKNGCDVRYVEKTVNQWYGNTSFQSHSIPTGCEANGGIFTVREVNNYAPDFTNMKPVPQREQNSNADAYPENQTFVDPSCDDCTTAQHKPPSRRSEQAYRKSGGMQNLIRTRGNHCSVCLKKFASPSKLARHFLIHMGLKPFKCQVCSKSFRQLCHLQTHMKVHDKNVQNAVSGGTQSQPTSGEVESTSNRHVFDSALHPGSPSQGLHFPHREHSHYKDYNENNQPLVSFVNESGHSEIKNSDYGFSNISDQKQEVNPFTVQPLTQSLSAQDKQHLNVSEQHVARVFPSQPPQHTHDRLEIKQTSVSPGCPTYTTANATLESDEKVRKAATCPTPLLDYLMEKGKGSGDDGLGLTEGPHVPITYPAHAQLKEEVFELQFEMEGVDSRLSKPPNDLLICPDCSQCFPTECKLNLHKCVSRQSEERERSGSGYQCAICFKSFQVPSKLKRHYVIHTGHRPFQCSLCSKTFTQAGHLKTHLHTHK
ncbi:zinc finger protein 721 [Clupea harengus]|uniref:Zinc finger protein 721 n=1 Tax=Clupea harengus TaxID=7950 RepID=A0A6P8GRU1_CLUHA|nr:zinc finger protein 721 [Clupea harengus]